MFNMFYGGYSKTYNFLPKTDYFSIFGIQYGRNEKFEKSLFFFCRILGRENFLKNVIIYTS